VDTGVFLRTNEQGVCFQVYVDYHEHGNVGWISTEQVAGHKRMIIRPFDLFGTLDENGKLNSLTTKPDERDIAWKPDYLRYSATPQAFLDTWKISQWNTMRIRCKGDQVTITLNGEKVVDADMNAHEELKNRPRKGYIGLQNHGSGLEFRNVRLRKLD
jgi:hypothetical protein